MTRPASAGRDDLTLDATLSPAVRLRQLAGRVRRLGGQFRGDPERPTREREEIETEILAIARCLDDKERGRNGCA